MDNLNQFKELEKLLRNESRYCTEDGHLLKNAIVEAALAMRPDLLRLLLSHKALRNNFFTEVDGMKVFDKVKFQKFVMNKRFLPDSYTCFKNKVGITDAEGDNFLSESREVVLSWPYKDCMLEGGQTKEDAKRNEVFWNEILAPDEINRLTEPKVLNNFRRYDAEGEHDVTKVSKEDNFIIKGNNLLALYSLKKYYAGKIKLIYIDPPYNTGNDGFGYNDSFNHSSWLTFMRNRLSVARQLLSNDGSLWVTCDDNEQAYLKVLMDELFGQSNFVATFIWKHRKSSQNDIDVSLSHNYNIVFAKNRNVFRLNSLEANVAKFTNPDNDSRGNWVADPMDAPNIRTNLSYEIVNPNTGEIFLPPAGRHWRFTKEKYIEALQDNRIVFGKSGKTKPQYKRFQSEAEDKGENTFSVWDDISTATDATKEIINLFGRKEFSTPKPEELIKRIIELGSKEEDLILDFHLGSGTTAAVAHKMNRRYIGIEQMDYIQTVSVERLKKVIEGEQGGISQSVNWQGGGSFIYCELATANQRFVDSIEKASSTDELQSIWKEMQATGFLSWKVKPQEIDENINDFGELSLYDQKRFLIESLDKNLLYVPYSEINNEEFGINQSDKDLNSDFYSIR